MSTRKEQQKMAQQQLDAQLDQMKAEWFGMGAIGAAVVTVDGGSGLLPSERAAILARLTVAVSRATPTSDRPEEVKMAEAARAFGGLIAATVRERVGAERFDNLVALVKVDRTTETAYLNMSRAVALLPDKSKRSSAMLVRLLQDLAVSQRDDASMEEHSDVGREVFLAIEANLGVWKEAIVAIAKAAA